MAGSPWPRTTATLRECVGQTLVSLGHGSRGAPACWLKLCGTWAAPLVLQPEQQARNGTPGIILLAARGGGQGWQGLGLGPVRPVATQAGPVSRVAGSPMVRTGLSWLSGRGVLGCLALPGACAQERQSGAHRSLPSAAAGHLNRPGECQGAKGPGFLRAGIGSGGQGTPQSRLAPASLPPRGAGPASTCVL